MDLRLQAVKLVTQYYDAFNNGDNATMLACLCDDFVHDVNQGGRRVGKKLFAEFRDHMDKCYSENLTDMVIMASEDGTRASAEFIVNGVYKSTDSDLPPAAGQTYKLPAGAFFDVKGGKIARVTTYYNLQDWIAQVCKPA
ncbi:MAG: nuclear transport factor 2 family protein [Alphaproteobacteria bacterium]|nr:nuclear transport factor 2 family protein [Alphaproteobacteria bacterium]